MILILTDCFEKSIPLVVGEVVENCVVFFHVTNVDHFDPIGTNGGQCPNWLWPAYLLYFYIINHKFTVLLSRSNTIDVYIFILLIMIAFLFATRSNHITRYK